MEKKELKERFIDEKTGIEYVRQGDYYIPNLVIPMQEKIQLNKYGRMRLNYLKEHKRTEYTIMLMEGTLTKHLKEIQETATKRVNQNGEMVIAMNNNDIVIMKMEEYREKLLKEDIEEHLLKAEDDIRNGRVRDAREVFKEWKEKYGI